MGVSRRLRPARCTRRVRWTSARSRRRRFTARSIMRLSASSWVSPGPPRKPRPPRWRSRWVQVRTRRDRSYSNRASSTCNRPSLVRARRPNISRIRPVRSITFTPSRFSRFRCWIGVRAASIMTIEQSWPFTSASSRSKRPPDKR